SSLRGRASQPIIHKPKDGVNAWYTSPRSLLTRYTETALRASAHFRSRSHRMITKPYALAGGEGRAYEWHGVLFTIKAAAAETGGLLSVWEVATRAGEDAHPQVNEEDEYISLFSRTLSVHCTAL